MAFDNSLKLTGSGTTLTETVTATANGTGVYAGADREFVAELRIGAAPTGTNPTLDIVLEDSADDSSYSAMGIVFPQQTAATVAATAALKDPVLRRGVVTQPGRPYVRIAKTIGGSNTPSFTLVSVLLQVENAQPVAAR